MSFLENSKYFDFSLTFNHELFCACKLCHWFTVSVKIAGNNNDSAKRLLYHCFRWIMNRSLHCNSRRSAKMIGGDVTSHHLVAICWVGARILKNCINYCMAISQIKRNQKLFQIEIKQLLWQRLNEIQKLFLSFE